MYCDVAHATVHRATVHRAAKLKSPFRTERRGNLTLENAACSQVATSVDECSHLATRCIFSVRIGTPPGSGGMMMWALGALAVVVMAVDDVDLTAFDRPFALGHARHTMANARAY